MISSGNEPNDSTITFLPHQKAFLDLFFNPTSKRIILLRAETGLGKGVTFVALANRLLQERPTARVLFVFDRIMLREQYLMMLRKANARALRVDRYYFRAMLDSHTGEDIWPSGMAAVLTLDFATQPDILDSLTETHWDLVIIDEANVLSGIRAKAFRKIIEAADRVVLTTGLAIELPDTFPAEETALVEWRRYQMVGHDGERLDTAVPPVLHEIPFTLTVTELTLRATVSSLSEVLGNTAENQNFEPTTFHRMLESSPVALEGELHKQRFIKYFKTRRKRYLRSYELLEAYKRTYSRFDELAGPYKYEIVWKYNRATREKAFGIAERVLQEIEQISGDSKLSAFGELLCRLDGSKMQQKRICVCTSFLDTLYYLSAKIEERGMSYQLLYGGMGAADRDHSVTLFSKGEKILVATSAATEDVDLPEVTDLILYDIPDMKIELQQLLGRFDRFDRRSQLNVYAFVPSNSPDGFIAASIALLRDLLADQGGLAPESSK